ncbi:MAG: hypothetical protein IPL83_20805 [Bdellovibrionales bacterium]|nr:hypothetical protein [Bdellovibrionales bacterium]
MFRLTPAIVLIFISTSILATPSGDRPPSETGACTKVLATMTDQNDQNRSAQLKAMKELNDKAESQLAMDSLTDKEDQTLLIKALRDRANEVLSAAEYSTNEQRRRGTHQAHEVPQIVLTAFQLARELESLQSPLTLHRLGSTWLQTIVPIDTPSSVLYERNDVSERPSSSPAPAPAPASSPIQRIEILAAKELLLYRGQKLASTLYGAIYLLSYKEGDSGIPQIFKRIDRKRMEFHKVDIPPKPSSQRAKKMRITDLSNALWEEIPEPSEREMQILLISDSVKTTIPLAAAAAARRKAERNQKEAHNFPELFWKFVTEK